MDEATGTDTVETSGEPGKQRGPIAVALLPLVTFGLYTWYWIFSTTKEMEDFDPHRDSPYTPAKWALVLPLVALVVAFAGVGMMFFGAASGSEGGLGASMVVLVLSLAIFVIGALAMLVAYWRLWSAIQDHEQAIAAPGTISPGLMLALMVVPVVNMFGIFYVPYRTQKGLNRVWQAADDGYQARPPPQVGAPPSEGTSAAE